MNGNVVPLSTKHEQLETALDCHFHQIQGQSHKSAFANQAAAKVEQAAMMAHSLNNHANTTLQKNDTVERFVSANECLAKALADLNAAIACLRLPTPVSASSGSSGECPEHGQHHHWSGILRDTVGCMDGRSNMGTPALPAPIERQAMIP